MFMHFAAAASLIAGPALAQPTSVGMRIEVTDSSGQVKRFTDSEIRLCDQQTGGSVEVDINHRARRASVKLRGVRLCNPGETPQVRLSASECSIMGGVTYVAISQSCTW